MKHLSHQQLLDFVESNLNNLQAAEHLAACQECKLAAEELRAVYFAAKATDVPEPHEAYWTEFRNRMADRVRAVPSPSPFHVAWVFFRRAVFENPRVIGAFATAVFLFALGMVFRNTLFQHSQPSGQEQVQLERQTILSRSMDEELSASGDEAGWALDPFVSSEGLAGEDLLRAALPKNQEALPNGNIDNVLASVSGDPFHSLAELNESERAALKKLLKETT